MGVDFEQPEPPVDEHGNVPDWYHPLRPPFEPGNTAAVTHGAWSAAIVEPLALELLEEVRPTVTWWTPADEPTVQAWARVEVRIRRITEWLSEHGGEITAEGDVVGAANMLSRLEKNAESLRSKLGLDPLSRSKLGKNVAQGQHSAAQAMAAQANRRAQELAEREGSIDVDGS